MKNIKPVVLFFLLLWCVACKMNSSKARDGASGIQLVENGLSAARVYTANGQEETDNRTFTYGQKIYTNFVAMEGLTEADGMIYPQMAMYVISKVGDTVMQQRNMFTEEKIGLDATDPSINGHVVLARPIYSGASYSLHYYINDTRSDASMQSKMNFELVPDANIKVVSNGLTYSEAYIYSEDEDEVVAGGVFNFYENLRFDFQDLDGYHIKDGAIHLGMSVKVIDANDTEMLFMADLFENPITNEELLKQGISSTLIIKDGQLANPLKWEVRIWDKNSSAKLRAQAEIQIKK